MQTNHLPGVPGGDDEQFNAGEATAAEAAALALPEDDTVVDTSAADAEAARLEAERVATEAAEAAEAARVAAAAAEVQHPGDAPAPPEDFAAAREHADEQVRQGLFDPVDYANERDRIRDAELAFKAVADAHAAATAAYTADSEARAAARQANEDAWNDDYKKFATDNAHFMSDAVHVRDTQTYMDAILKANPDISNADLLAQAYEKAATKHGYKKPDGEEDALAKALRDRHQAPPGTNLGDVPTARNLTITGNETYAELDGLGIEALEDVVAAMSPAQLEKYLRAAPGANETGRD